MSNELMVWRTGLRSWDGRCRALAAALVLGVVGSLVWGQESVINSPHNLSATGPGEVRAAGEQQVCIFCHTPHRAMPIQPLWNRYTPVSAYTPYTSNSLQAEPGQPTGASKLCLSCHDGTIALGGIVSRTQPVQMAGGITTLPPGRASNLGTDLSDDHPISFEYTEALVAKNPKLRDPATLPPGVRLDAQQELQCTTCHEPHDNRWGKFLVMDNSNSQLCNSCHQQGTTTVAGHGQCASCHAPHTAPSGPYLLKQETVSLTCLTCHSSAPALLQGPDVGSDVAKVSNHDTNSAVNLAQHIPDNAVCKDCHEPHTMRTGTAEAPNIPPNLGSVSGMNASGAIVPAAQFGYEVCFKCHADQGTGKPLVVSRQIMQTNTRLEFDPAAVSYHPVEAPGKNNDVPSLRPEWTTASLIACTDCHASDSNVAGPHGSNHGPVLAAGYTMTDPATEGPDAYALCYRCHDRDRLLSDETFPHRRHVVDERTACFVCHDPHGIPAGPNPLNHRALINFNTTVVRPNAQGQLAYVSGGSRSGACSLSCHNADHANREYPAQVMGPLTPDVGPEPVPIEPAPLAPESNGTLRRMRRR